MKTFFQLLFCVFCLSFQNCEAPKQIETNFDLSDVPVTAPFSKLDTLATNDWWNRDSSKIINLKVPREEVIAFGIYTVSNNTLKLSAQLFPLYPDETREVRLEIKKKDKWAEVQRQKVNDIGWSALFRP